MNVFTYILIPVQHWIGKLDHLTHNCFTKCYTQLTRVVWLPAPRGGSFCSASPSSGLRRRCLAVVGVVTSLPEPAFRVFRLVPFLEAVALVFLKGSVDAITSTLLLNLSLRMIGDKKE